MKENYTSAQEVASELGLYLKVVTSVSTFENYNSFFNIYDQYEDYCRRIVVLTPFEDLEEVYDEKPDKPITPNTMVDGNIWLREYPLTTNPNNIPIKDIMISKELIKEILLKNNNAE